MRFAGNNKNMFRGAESAPPDLNRVKSPCKIALPWDIHFWGFIGGRNEKKKKKREEKYLK